MDTALLQVAAVPALAAIPGLEHGFERRRASPPGESREGVRERVARGLQDLGRLFLMQQVHGARVVRAPFEGRPEADAAVALAAGVVLGVETADCLPVLLVDPARRSVAAVHAGWRGTASEVAVRAVEAMRDQGSRAEDLVAALGPGIGPCCYEVGDELRPAFDKWGGDVFRLGPRSRPPSTAASGTRKAAPRSCTSPVCKRRRCSGYFRTCPSALACRSATRPLPPPSASWSSPAWTA